MAKPRTVLVTGCAGFIGNNFVKQFAAQFPETTIVGIDNFSTGRRDADLNSVVFHKGSVLDEDFLDVVFEQHKPEYVFHFAAIPRVSYSLEFPVISTKVNVVGTVAILEAARQHGTKRVIYSSSSSIYGGTKQLPTKESNNPPNPKSPYAVQKYVGEPFCRVFSELFGLQTICLRYFNAFGPGQYGDSAYASVIPAWLGAIYAPGHKPPFIEGDGEQSRDFCYVDNIVNANILAMRADGVFAGDVFNIAHGERTSLNEVKQLIEEYSGRTLDLEKRPPRPGDIKHSYADISKAREVLGYEPKVGFNEGLKRTIEWFRANH
jgi:UDP-glucose 4-epimerase